MVRLEPYHLMSLALEPQPWNTNKFMATATWKWHKVGHGSREKPRCTFLGLTLLDVFLFFPCVHVWPTERFFLGWGGAGRAKNSQFFQPYFFQFWLHACSCETRSIERNMRIFVGRGSRSRWQRDYDPTIHGLITENDAKSIIYVRFSSRPENSTKNDTN